MSKFSHDAGWRRRGRWRQGYDNTSTFSSKTAELTIVKGQKLQKYNPVTALALCKLSYDVLHLCIGQDLIAKSDSFNCQSGITEKNAIQS